ncbi:headcase protein-like isoform X1 [Condylostylus longicornis]|uniref:headcase protein-like isoform X1 n=2 Tax=Condylostylus longicornis TaxID=2530218 RepID=UPI00244E0484|nr:headcase protein-like isoform X1 [Condylostylus longicornis]
MAPRRNNNNHHSHPHSGGVIIGVGGTTPNSVSSNSSNINNLSLNQNNLQQQQQQQQSPINNNINQQEQQLNPIVDVQALLGLAELTISSSNLSIIDPHNNNNNNNSLIQNNSANIFDIQQQQQLSMSNENLLRCCVPTGDCFKADSNDFGIIGVDDLSECIRVICNNENCTAGQYMHRECFESWEQTVLNTLKSIGRARSWSDRQRQQNLWTKKGYDLVYKACGCKCGRGHLKKDLDWTPPPPQNTNVFGRSDDESNKKKKKKNKNNQKPTLTISSNNINNNNTSNGGINANNNGNGNYHTNTNIAKQPTTPNGNTNHTNMNGNTNNSNGLIELRQRTGSLSSSNGSTSPPVSASSDHSISPIHNNGNLSNGIGGVLANGVMKKQSITNQPQQQQQQQMSQEQYQQHLMQQQHTAQQLAKTKVEIHSERVRYVTEFFDVYSQNTR